MLAVMGWTKPAYHKWLAVVVVMGLCLGAALLAGHSLYKPLQHCLSGALPGYIFELYFWILAAFAFHAIPGFSPSWLLISAAPALITAIPPRAHIKACFGLGNPTDIADFLAQLGLRRCAANVTAIEPFQ